MRAGPLPHLLDRLHIEFLECRPLQTGGLVEVGDVAGRRGLGHCPAQDAHDLLGYRLTVRLALARVELGHPHAHLLVEAHLGGDLGEVLGPAGQRPHAGQLGGQRAETFPERLSILFSAWLPGVAGERRYSTVSPAGPRPLRRWSPWYASRGRPAAPAGPRRFPR